MWVLKILLNQMYEKICYNKITKIYAINFMKNIYASIRKNKIKALSMFMMKMMKTSTSIFGVKTQILDIKTNISLSAKDLILSMRKIKKDSGI